MSSGFRVSEHINYPVETVWRVLTDWKRAPEWMKGIDEMRAPEAATIAVGTELEFRARGAARTTTITAWSPPHRLTLRSKQGGMTATYEYSCEAEEDGSRLTLHAQCVASGFGWKLAAPAIGYLMKRADSGQIRSLKARLESERANA